MWWVYIIEKENKYYTGITTDLKNRIRQHGVNMYAFKEPFENKYLASKREREIKGWSRIKKTQLITNFSK